jgi:murein DD-endopeptidase MepM/ murein hydrolase activator NlpD
MHNPFADYRISQGWAVGSHATYHAIDFATPVGTKFGAPDAGVYRRMPTNGSRTNPAAPGVWAHLIFDDGSRIVFCHLQKHIAEDGERVVEGQPLACTGNTGFVRPTPTRANPSAGAHMHTYGLSPSGKRVNWVSAVNTLPASSGAVRRRAKRTAIGRTHGSRKAKAVQTLKKGQTGTFRGFVRGDWVTAHGVSTNIWYVGASHGRRFWAGNFTVISTEGLRDLTGK